MDDYAQLCHGLSARPDGKGEVYVACPNCGKGDRHFSFNQRSGFCFRCGFKTGLHKLRQMLLGDRVLDFAPPPAPRPRRPPRWLPDADSIANSLASQPGTISAWQSYKPVPVDAIADFRLGWGVFPGGLWDSSNHYRCRHRRLIVPLTLGGRVVGFRCRAVECGCAKWLSPGGSRLTLFNAENVIPGRLLFIVENPIDAILLHYTHHQPAVATLGVTIWKIPYTRLVTAASHRLVAYDNDPSGCTTDPEKLAEWTRHHPDLDPPLRGFWLADKLSGQHLPTDVFDWSHYPDINDIGDLLMTRKPNQTLALAQWFVTEYLGRAWTPADYSGSHMKHASILLKHYRLLDVTGCLSAIRLGLMEWSFSIDYLASLTKGEPPLMERWLALKATPPPVWNIHRYNQWARLTGHDELPETLPPAQSRLPVWPGPLRSEPDSHPIG